MNRVRRTGSQGPVRVVLAVLAAVTAGLALVVVSWRYNRPPEPLDAAAAMVLLGCGLTMPRGRRHDLTASLLLAASLSWSLPALAPTGSAAADQALRGLTLTHVTCMSLAVLVAGGWGLFFDQGRRPVTEHAAAALAVVAGASAVTGGWRIALPTAGIMLVVATWPMRSPLRWAGMLLGGSLGASAVVRHFEPSPDEAFLFRLHAACILAAGVLVAVDAVHARRPASAASAADRLGQAITALGAALEQPGLIVVLGAQGGGWLAVDGQPAFLTREPHLVVGPLDDPVAALTPVPRRIPASVEQALLLLRHHARLRATLAESLTALSASQQRLVASGDAERRALGDELRAGVLARLDRVVEALAHDADVADVHTLAVTARAELEHVAAGLDPLRRGADLTEALRGLAASSPLDVQLDVCGIPTQEAIRRVLWFACTEGLANAAKHAPGSHVSIVLEQHPAGWQLVIADDGPGGAHDDGSGLRGLADRVEAVGGQLVVVSAPLGGTTLTVTVPGPLRQVDAREGRVAAPEEASILVGSRQ